ncbi:hypothetical protein [Agrilutibacter solisilvae]|uniref:Uncharacterized protein n=1 Tax=Agrilutibacter solisilvae TaxID=2763317 RepID=A0A974Y1A9_9GAMM|nr:hypothetical protein [Lysobacter solisilvae]QSX79408.1 hypothetical protein I8J32_005975 [Lysobacter solisilvae]
MRDAFVTHLKHGKSAEEAIQAILVGYGRSLENHEVECLVLFSLADTAWKHGRLTADVRDRALALIAQGGDMAVWERDAPGDAPLRRQALDRLRARLLSPQPAPKRIMLSSPKPKRIICTDPVGTVFLLDLPTQGKAAMVVVAYVDLGSSVEPIFSVLDWRGPDVPARAELGRCSAKSLVFSSGLGNRRHVGILCFDKRKNPIKPLERTGLVLPDLPYDNEGKVFVTLSRIAQEADAQLGAPAL